MEKLEKELDRVFSIWVRVSYASHEGYVHCYTCPEQLPWQQTENGHFVPRAHSAVRFHVNNTRPQCPNCNRFLNGRPDVFEENLRDEIGDEEVDEVIALGRTEKHYTEKEYRELISHYKLALKNLGVII